MKTLFIFMLVCLLSGCANKSLDSGQAQWDFDHQVQFRQSKLADGRYHLEVISNEKTHFNRLATFLMRRALQVCQQYGFTLVVLEGVEEFNDRIGLPNMIMPSLAANLTCPNK